MRKGRLFLFLEMGWVDDEVLDVSIKLINLCAMKRSFSLEVLGSWVFHGGNCLMSIYYRGPAGLVLAGPVLEFQNVKVCVAHDDVQRMNLTPPPPPFPKNSWLFPVSSV